MRPKIRPNMRLDARVRALHSVSWNQARQWIETGKIFSDGRALRDPGLLVDPEIALELKMNAPRASREAPAPEIPVVFEDSQIVVVEKPAGISTVPFEDREMGSLIQLLERQLGRGKLKVVQRLDRETSGLLVFARTDDAERALAQQFRFHSVQRRYFALAHGKVPSGTIRSLLAKNRGDGLRGSWRPGAGPREDAKEAITHVAALAHFEGRTLIECRLETGRTHQIRIHLAESGHPLLGEKAYHRDYSGELLPAPRILLHAAELGINHPAKRTPLRWTSLPPPDFLALLGETERELLKTRLEKPLK